MHGTHGAGFTMRFGTVFHRTTSEIVALNSACKAFAAGYAACIDQFTSCENFSSDFLTDCIFRRSRQTQFSDKLNRRYASFVKMAFHRFGGMFFFNFTKTKLNSVITVCFFGFVLKYYARTSFYNSYRNQLAVSFKNLGHAQFFA